MKPGAFVLNVARGGILDEAAVADALRSGHLGGAGIDVFETEPPTGSPLLDAPNTLLTPHLGASTAEAQILGRRGGRRPGHRRPRRAQRPVRRERAAPDPRDGPGDRAVPAAGRDPRPVLRPVLARTGVQTLTLEIAGELAAYDAAPLTAAVLRGLLETSITERVNLVNAVALAKARGITIVERRTPRRRRVRAPS